MMHPAINPVRDWTKIIMTVIERIEENSGSRSGSVRYKLFPNRESPTKKRLIFQLDFCPKGICVCMTKCKNVQDNENFQINCQKYAIWFNFIRLKVYLKMIKLLLKYKQISKQSISFPNKLHRKCNKECTGLPTRFCEKKRKFSQGSRGPLQAPMPGPGWSPCGGPGLRAASRLEQVASLVHFSGYYFNFTCYFNFSGEHCF